jgi:hypothetical protein
MHGDEYSEVEVNALMVQLFGMNDTIHGYEVM